MALLHEPFAVPSLAQPTGCTPAARTCHVGSREQRNLPQRPADAAAHVQALVSCTRQYASRHSASQAAGSLKAATVAHARHTKRRHTLLAVTGRRSAPGLRPRRSAR